MFDSNPSVVQEPLPGDPAARATPLVLLHDGGGTVYSYYLLEDLGRPVYAVANPRFYSGEPWAGGLREMARAYVRYVREAVPPGRILLGGWSLGGLLALEMASQLAADPMYRVAGIVMIDSVCPLRWQQLAAGGSGGGGGAERPILRRKLEWGEHTREETKVAVTRSFEQAGKMVGEWELPAWKASPGPPPAILLRALEEVPVPEEQGVGILRVDVHRDDPMLGWDEYRKDLFRRVDDIPGHHFSIFEFGNIPTVTEKLADACRTLDKSGP